MKTLISRELDGVRATVIGSGVAGLSAAIGLAARGARVRVLDRNDSPASDRVARKPLPVGEDLLDFPWVFARLFALADLRLTDFVAFEPVDPMFHLVLPGGERLAITRRRDELAGAVAALDRDDGRRFAALLDAAEPLARVAEESFLGAPSRPGRSPWRALAARPRSLALALAAAHGSPLDARLRQRFNGPAAPALLACLSRRLGCLSAGCNPGLMGPAAALLLRGLWQPEGGHRALLVALQRVAALAGVRVQQGADVERIDTDGARARAVLGEGFRPLRSDIVVSTLSRAATAEALAARKAGTAARAAGASAPRGFVPRATLAWEFEWKGPEAFFPPGLCVLAADCATDEAEQLDRWQVPAAAPEARVMPLAARPGWMRAEMDTVAPGPAWRWNEANAQRLRHALAARLEALGAKGVEACIGEEVLLAPREGQRPVHLAAGPRAWMRRAPNAWPEIAGLYLAGPDAHPGATTSLRALAGALAAEAAAADER